MKDAKGHGSNSRGTKNLSGMSDDQAKDFLRRSGVGVPGKPPAEHTLVAAHSAGVQEVGQPTPAPNFRLNSYTHEIVSPTGDVSARMRLGKNNGLAVDYPAGPRGSSGMSSISRSGGPSIHDTVAMADYRASKPANGDAHPKSGEFPAEHIAGALHFLTGNDFAGHTVRRVK